MLRSEAEDDPEDLDAARARSSPSWATSTTARPRCSTPSARPTSPPARPAASPSTSAPTRSTADGGEVVFLDTPGHEAFTAMRARGAQVTDIVVLVVAADDGVMPQTIEAINHAKAAEVPIIVAVNKIDKPAPTRTAIRQQLSEHGLIPEEWGGDTIFVDVSAQTKDGHRQAARDASALQAEVLELKANPNKAGQGHVVEASSIATAARGDGPRAGRHAAARRHRRRGRALGKVRAMLDDKGATGHRGRPVDAGRGPGPRRRARRGRDVQRRRRREGGQGRWSSTAARRAARRSWPARGTRVAREHPRQDQGGRGQGAQDHPQGRRAGLGRGARERAHRAVDREGEGQRHLGRRRRHHRVRRQPGQGVGSAIIVGFNVRPAGKARSWPSRKASTSSSTTSSTRPSTT